MSDPANAPAALGRGVIVEPGGTVPGAWSTAARIEIGDADLEDGTRASSLVEELRRRWIARESLVLELALDPEAFRGPESVVEPPYELAPDLPLSRDALHHLVWANNYDARGGSLVWWWSLKAERLGATVIEDGRGDVALGDGRAWVDGGPRWSAPSLDLPVLHSSTIDAGRLETSAGAGGDRAATDLADDQRAAVLHPGGPVRVIAPAGSGKTRVLTERVRHLLAERGYDRDLLLAVAYNKEAQRELEARLFRLQPRTRTLNSLGYRIVSEHRGGRPPLLDEIEVRTLVGDVFPIPRRRRDQHRSGRPVPGRADPGQARAAAPGRRRGLAR